MIYILEINFGGVYILELATDTMLEEYRCSYQYHERQRCLREKFVCLSLFENVHKKNNFSTTNSLELAADKFWSIDFGTSVRYNAKDI